MNHSQYLDAILSIAEQPDASPIPYNHQVVDGNEPEPPVGIVATYAIYARSPKAFSIYSIGKQTLPDWDERIRSVSLEPTETDLLTQGPVATPPEQAPSIYDQLLSQGKELLELPLCFVLFIADPKAEEISIHFYTMNLFGTTQCWTLLRSIIDQISKRHLN